MLMLSTDMPNKASYHFECVLTPTNITSNMEVCRRFMKMPKMFCIPAKSRFNYTTVFAPM